MFKATPTTEDSGMSEIPVNPLPAIRLIQRKEPSKRDKRQLMRKNLLEAFLIGSDCLSDVDDYVSNLCLGNGTRTHEYAEFGEALFISGAENAWKDSHSRALSNA